MTDLHTHILPNMDDGAQSIDESIGMLRMELEQGVNCVALTPHFYADRESIEDFLRRREAAWENLCEAVSTEPNLPRLILGAEAAFTPAMMSIKHPEQLCYTDTRYILLEMPFAPWTDHILNELLNFVNKTGLTPVFAHIDRYLASQTRTEIQKLLEMGFPIQVGADYLTKPLLRRRVLSLFQSGQTHILVSDCHNLEDRKPNMKQGFDILHRHLGEGRTAEIMEFSDRLLDKISV